MNIKKAIYLLLTLGLVEFLAADEGKNYERIFNPEGWNIPDVSKLTFLKTEKLSLPGLPFAISGEWWMTKEGSRYHIKNYPGWGSEATSVWSRKVDEEVGSLTIYKGPEGQVLFYLYMFLIKDDARHEGAYAEIICDLDGDGVNESQFGYTSQQVPEKIMAAIAGIKVGISDESQLVKRMVISALHQLGEARTKGE